MTLLQIILAVFSIFALTRVLFRFRDKQLKPAGLFFWMALFVSALVGVVFPFQLSGVAKFFGIGRGADLIIYVSIIILFYLVFRIYILMEDLRLEITQVVRQLALQNEAPTGLRPRNLLPLLGRERNPSEAENSPHSFPLRAKYSAKGDKDPQKSAKK